MIMKLGIKKGKGSFHYYIIIFRNNFNTQSVVSLLRLVTLIKIIENKIVAHPNWSYNTWTRPSLNNINLWHFSSCTPLATQGSLQELVDSSILETVSTLCRQAGLASVVCLLNILKNSSVYLALFFIHFLKNLTVTQAFSFEFFLD